MKIGILNFIGSILMAIFIGMGLHGYLESKYKKDEEQKIKEAKALSADCETVKVSLNGTKSEIINDLPNIDVYSCLIMHKDKVYRFEKQDVKSIKKYLQIKATIESKTKKTSALETDAFPRLVMSPWYKNWLKKELQ